MSDDERDLDLLRDLDDAYDELPPVPGHLRDSAMAAFEWRRIDLDLAELLFDSATDTLAGVRHVAGAGTSRTFRFGALDSIIRVHLGADVIVISVDPAMAIACRIASAYDGGSVSAHTTDELGELTVDAPPLPVRVELDFPERVVVTPWIVG